MIDFHSHILPAIDDGPQSLLDSADMLDTSLALAFNTVVATPHLAEPLTPGYADQVGAAFRQVESLALSRGVRLVQGYEVRLVPQLAARLEQGEPITIGETKAVLVDLAIADWPLHAENSLFAMQVAGFQPILAHPERYPRIQNDPRLGSTLARRGVVLQVTIGSFANLFGRRSRRAAETLLRLGAVHLVATDAHSACGRLSAVRSGIIRLESLVGQDATRHLTETVPETLLAGHLCPHPLPVPSRAARFRVLPFARH